MQYVMYNGVSVGVQAVRWYFTHWETIIFMYYRIAKYI